MWAGRTRLSQAVVSQLCRSRNRLTILLSPHPTPRHSLTVEVHDGVLTIAGERKSEHTEGDGTQFHRVERSYGNFQRSFRLPPDTDADNISADHSGGQLTITLPKTKPKAERSRIAIKRS